VTREGLNVPRLRVARPSRDLAAARSFYAGLVGLDHLGGFAGHAGYDGVFLGAGDGSWHLELTRHESGQPAPSPTEEDLLVLYLDGTTIASLTERLTAAGHTPLRHPNPYWEGVGAVVVADPDGYLLVLCPEPAGRPSPG
jgi:catechol 2,3-dioxygenase-like lactoylglutathione lyase family enzyme